MSALTIFSRVGDYCKSLFFVCLASICLPACVDEEPKSELALAQDGTFIVQKTQRLVAYQGAQSGDIATQIYLPKTASEQPLPLVIFSPGFGAKANFYTQYYQHLASHGIAVAAIDLLGELGFDSQHDDKAMQIVEVVNALLSSELNIDEQKLALAGHSQGAKLAFYAATLRDDISVVLALDPVNAGGPPCFIAPTECANYPVAPNPTRAQVGLLDQLGSVASLILRSEPDSLTNPEAEFNASWFFAGSDGIGTQAVPPPALYVDMGATPHADYVTIVANQTLQVAKHFMLAWLEHHWDIKPRDDIWSADQAQRDQRLGYYQSLSLRAN